MRILVIENEEKHVSDAQVFFTNHPDIEVVFASDFASAQEYLEPGKVAGVISDIFFLPSTRQGPWGRKQAFPSNNEWEQYACCGVAVMMLCWERVIPCILNTSEHHHGTFLQWICMLQRGLELPEMVDVTTFGKDEWNTSSKKNWKEALNKLQRLIELGPCQQHNRYHWNVIQERDGSFRRQC